ncbi:TPA: undecaprenyl-diphosphatase [Candidatus Collierbacteria bacterium]|uniref:Undecaprenyl-diphosphatase n=1 Tax=Candidatus Collierbacteria bacterium GW2011_GWA2_42_17 TaxID=1618378 RepID=A0A0G0Z2D8_9BACT|nr:MAG: Undecaprenyl-diphosphatase [Candidatus Collierbacteria bacterium GW2011_GWB2_42_12]KKS42955.1 MAG: Undecaprenyl-diphosphatase [Candidatus Collierbacteria bacterium GW2011_GWA2_42_17]KKS62115.1 MAG: Undecaprenyl-diphosphatase [Candidatus Collierbacteria bacterium GW2011_GWD2_42_50]KKS62751.1 MAG: Undecaprenyl-diphosphatase [Candidatus Collierbacteria bacterium GW2011_GWE2_42_48]KKS67383.1 MAG: Undecaprenyl-diphosphatase [Candidatus Collierbacteria bacterium GW2011_GWA1_42_60]HAI22246.1 
MTNLQTIILAVVEGLTEFLPVSSTGHLILTQKLLGITTTEFTKSFDIFIQLSAILAVVVLYWKKIIGSRHLWRQLIVAFIPTGVLGLIFYKYVKGFLLDNVFVTVLALLIGGFILLIIDRLPKLALGSKKISELNSRSLLSVGLFQSLSMIPGVSRSAASIIGGLFSSLSRVEAVEFSFLLAIPTMIAASGYDLLKTGFSFTSREFFLLALGSLFSFLASILAVRSFTSFVAKHNFTVFAIYRIVFAFIVLWLLNP